MKVLFLTLLAIPTSAFAQHHVSVKDIIENTKFFCEEEGASIEAYDLQSNPKIMQEVGKQTINECNDCTNPEEKRDGSVAFKLSENGLSATGRIVDPGNTHLTFEAYTLRMRFRIAHLNNGGNAVDTQLFLSRGEDTDIHVPKMRKILDHRWFEKGDNRKRLPVAEFKLKGLIPEGFGDWSDEKKLAWEKENGEIYSGDFTNMTVRCYLQR